MIPLGIFALVFVWARFGFQLPTFGAAPLTATFGKSANKIIFSAQQPGDTVVTGYVSLEHPSFVVIQEDIAGSPGKIIGVSKIVGTGSFYGVEVPLSRGVLPHELLYATLFADDGNGVFAPPGDLPLIDRITGISVSTSFIVPEKK